MSSTLGNGNITFGDGTTQSTAYTGTIGVGQTWQAVTRVSGTTYYNTTGKPIMVGIYSTGGIVTPIVGGVNIGMTQGGNNNTLFTTFFIVPTSASYSATNITSASELR